MKMRLRVNVNILSFEPPFLPRTTRALRGTQEYLSSTTLLSLSPSPVAEVTQKRQIHAFYKGNMQMISIHLNKHNTDYDKQWFKRHEARCIHNFLSLYICFLVWDMCAFILSSTLLHLLYIISDKLLVALSWSFLTFFYLFWHNLNFWI